MKLAWRPQAAKTIVTSHKVRKGGQDQELIQSRYTPDPGYHMGKSALSQRVATRQQ